MDDISSLIEAMTQFLNVHNELAQKNSLITTETIAIFAAVLSFIGLVFTTIYTIKQNSKLQNANARVEWIQNVRNVTAEIISTYSASLNEDDPKKLEKIIVEVREKIERLILFFGHEINTEKEIDILDTNSNEGKNHLIVEFLIKLSDEFIKYYKNVKSGDLSQAEARLDYVSSKLQDNIVGIAYQEDIEIDGRNYTSTEYKYNEETEKEYDDAQAKVSEIKRFNEELASNLVKLRNIIRIYLKIEWNKAKKGK
ncbi:hypothetical protein J2S13_003037 [Oikeobacillus pervagus]|uniref:Uncharacterized protein n=1 Tax=Oikeobacillus pervagus TaxID=1325931 RepID=A0AAJ1T8J0_9BACI|nr:hypothetical protein [Oikeobacillus pervagus]MDQ0216575.1 hypothetical protein [Oikeobacillus pervagus]